MTDTTRDEALWAQYAAAALIAVAAKANGTITQRAHCSADFADAMLAETRKRFPSAPAEAPQEPAPAFKVGDRVLIAGDVVWFASRVGRVIKVDVADDIQRCLVEADGGGVAWFRPGLLTLEPAPPQAPSAIEVTAEDVTVLRRTASILEERGYVDRVRHLASLADRLERAIGGGR